jgi:hypothetical protein
VTKFLSKAFHRQKPQSSDVAGLRGASRLWPRALAPVAAEHLEGHEQPPTRKRDGLVITLTKLTQ